MRAALAVVLAAAAAFAGCAAPAADDRGRDDGGDAPPDGAPEGRFVLAATTSSTEAGERWVGLLENFGIPAALVEDLNANLRLERDVEVTADDCGEVNAFYDPESRRITMCHDLLEHVRTLFEEAGHDETRAIEHALKVWTFVFFHEAGHALIDVNGLPATGREEDAVDQLSAIVVLSEDDGHEVALSAAEWFALESETNPVDEASFADEHSLDAQRFHNVLCWVYGSAPDRHESLVGEGGLTPERAEGCPDEYARMRDAWDALIGPYWKDA